MQKIYNYVLLHPSVRTAAVSDRVELLHKAYCRQNILVIYCIDVK
jgi:hypothetical protein